MLLNKFTSLDYKVLIKNYNLMLQPEHKGCYGSVPS